jgi:hypothetical protein
MIEWFVIDEQEINEMKRQKCILSNIPVFNKSKM